MIQFQYGLVCENLIVNQETEQVSIIDIIDNAQVEALPTVLPNLSIVAFWKRPEEDNAEEALPFKFRLIRRPELATKRPHLEAPEYEQEMATGVYNARTILKVSGIIIENEGPNRIIFEVYNDNNWVEVGSITIRVSVGLNPSDITSSPAGY